MILTARIGRSDHPTSSGQKDFPGQKNVCVLEKAADRIHVLQAAAGNATTA